MIKRNFTYPCASALALVAALAMPSMAAAQEAPAEEEATGLDVIVVTASGGGQRQLESSISVTSVSSDLIDDFQPSSEAEIFRLLPGIQVPGTSGPGGNSNIAVRGLPVATGGSPFVQLQEDGLPVVLFGDIQFGNNDYWTKFDATTASVEAVRGGSSTTFASQAPGAVINYISHTGREEGGFVELKTGLGFDEKQVNFRYGGPINDTLSFHVGGFAKKGRGPAGASYTVSESVQIKANITKEFDDGKGFFRLLFKYADTQEPNYTGAPALATISGNKVTKVAPFPGFDGRDQTNYSIYNQSFLIYNREGQLERVAMDGITTEQASIGAQFEYEFDDMFSVRNNMRYSDMSGGFASPFLGITRTSGILGSTVNGSTVARVVYASGPNAGANYTGTYLDNNVNVKTNIRDMGSFVNDFVLTGEFDTGFADLTARAGYFYMDQNIAADWHVNKSTRELNGDNPSQLDLLDAAGNRLTVEGISGYNNNWGNCCARDYDLNYTNTAPYMQLVLDNESFNLDGSIRFEKVKASGYTIAGGTEFPITSNGVVIPTMTANGAREVLDYSRSYTSWTGGALYKVTSDLSVFARASRGGRFNSDRQTVGGKFRADGGLCTADDVALRNSAGVITRPAQFGCASDGRTPSVDFVTQYELGIKNRGVLAGGDYTIELTLLSGKFKQSNYEPTVTNDCPTGGCVIDSNYKSKGLEMFATYRNGGFSLAANATYSDAKRKLSGATAFTRAPGIPDLSYTVTAAYDVADIATIGVAMVGQTGVFDGAFEYPGKAIFNTNLRVYPLDNVEVGLNVYNLFNTFDARGNGVGIADASVTPAVMTSTPALGRTVSASVKFNF